MKISAGKSQKPVYPKFSLNCRIRARRNINLVTATHYLPSVLKALDLAKPRLAIPVVYNCGG